MLIPWAFPSDFSIIDQLLSSPALPGGCTVIRFDASLQEK